MKKAKFLFWAVLALSAQTPEVHGQRVSKEMRQSILQQVLAEFGSKYRITAIVNVDSSTGNRLVADGAIEDPYGSLKGCAIFAAKGIDQGSDYMPKGFVGIFKNGKIIWRSDTLINNNVVLNVAVIATKDINRDGFVDIISSWYEGNGHIQYLWIFNWDGTSGHIENEYDNQNKSRLVTFSDDFELVDINGDGIKEIRGRWEKMENSEESEPVTYSWNGHSYGNWGNIPLPTQGGFLPRNKLEVSVSFFNVRSQLGLVYSYAIQNSFTSLQNMDEFLLQAQTATARERLSRRDWKFAFRKNRIVGWTNFIFMANHLGPGSKDSMFSYESPSLPKILSYFARGANQGTEQRQFSEEEWLKDIITNSYRGYSVGPADPPSPFIHSTFLDTLHSYTRQSAELGWLGKDRDNDSDNDEKPEDGIVRNIEQRLNKAKRQLERGDSVLARRELEKLVGKVERLWKRSQEDDKKDKRDRWEKKDKVVMTSEAYALLKYNTEYLIDRLPDRKPKKGSKDKD